MVFLVSVVAAMIDPLTAVPALLIGVFVRRPYLHFALPAWGVAIALIVVNLAESQQINMPARNILAIFIAALVVGYLAAGAVWLVRHKGRSQK